MGNALTFGAFQKQGPRMRPPAVEGSKEGSSRTWPSAEDELVRFLAGENLASIMASDRDHISSTTNSYIQPLFGVCRTLMGNIAADRSCYSIAEIQCSPDYENSSTEFWQLFFAMILSIYKNDFHSADIFLEEIKTRFRHPLNVPRAIEDCLIFYRGLVAALLASQSQNRRRKTRLRRAKRELQKLKSRRAEGGLSLCNKVFLVEAQIQVCREQHERALLLFHRSCEYADHHGLTHELSLAYELAGKMCQACHREDESDLYLSQAQDNYCRWGAFAKVEEMIHLKTSTCNRTQSTSSL